MLTQTGTREISGRRRPAADYLPDFCHIHSVLAVLIAGELVALVFTLANSPVTDGFWARLGLTSLFIQWIGLATTASLCLLKRKVRTLSIERFSVMGLGIIFLITLMCSLISLRFVLAGRVDLDEDWYFLFRNLVISLLMGAVVFRYFYLQQQYRLRLHSEAEARVQALQSKIRPHFLFNSLNTIASLIPDDPARAEALLEDFSDLFRASMAKPERLLPFSAERSLCERYLHIERQRIGERLNWQWRMDDFPEDMLMPPLSLQPLLENAVYHGIQARVPGGTIDIHCRLAGGSVEISVTNPLPEAGSQRPPGNQIALENIAERLRVLFGGDASLHIHQSTREFRARLRFPVCEEA